MFFSKKIIGIDIGVGSIKIVEISHSGNKNNLLNYGELKTEFIKNPSKGSFLKFSNDSIAEAIRVILIESKIRTKEVIFSIPDFSTFFTSFEIPYMTQKEIPGAINYNASQFITLPISEVALDWQIMKKNPEDKNSSMIVLLIAIPNKVIQDYQIIARLSGLELYALEAEVFGLTRVFGKDDQKIRCILDIGVESSTISITEGKYLRKSYSFDFSSSKINNEIESVLKIDKNKIEDLKIKEGLMMQDKNVVSGVLSLIDNLVSEVKVVVDNFEKEEKRPIQEICLTGGTANMIGLKDYFKKQINKEVSVPNCFSGISYPSSLESNILELSPRFSVAVGASLFGLQKFEI